MFGRNVFNRVIHFLSIKDTGTDKRPVVFRCVKSIILARNVCAPQSFWAILDVGRDI